MGERRECGWEMSSLERNTRGLKGFRLHSVRPGATVVSFLFFFS